MEVSQVLRMKAGQDNASYANNSLLQKLSLTRAKHAFKHTIQEFCLFCLPKKDCVKVADLGCASGPNTFLGIQEIIENISKESHNLNHELPSFQIFLNDLVSNDFNSIFKSLPTFYDKLEKCGCQSGSCFISATPGSFYGRLFFRRIPSILYTRLTVFIGYLRWSPRGLVDEMGLPLNKGNICIAKTSPPAVRDAYLDQFDNDFTKFLRMRSIEMVSHGYLFLTMMSNDYDIDGYSYHQLLGMTLNDMVVEEIIEETRLDAFDIPQYEPSEDELRNIIEREGSFEVRYLKTIERGWNDADVKDMAGSVLFDRNAFGEFMGRNMRAIYEPIVAAHFGDAIMDDLFSRYTKKISEYMESMKGSHRSLVVSLSKK